MTSCNPCEGTAH